MSHTSTATPSRHPPLQRLSLVSRDFTHGNTDAQGTAQRAAAIYSAAMASSQSQNSRQQHPFSATGHAYSRRDPPVPSRSAGPHSSLPRPPMSTPYGEEQAKDLLKHWQRIAAAVEIPQGTDPRKSPVSTRPTSSVAGSSQCPVPATATSTSPSTSQAPLPVFQPLVDVLQTFAREGDVRPLRNRVPLKLGSGQAAHNHIFVAAGYSSWREYAAEAERIGLIVLGRPAQGFGREWVALRTPLSVQWQQQNADTTSFCVKDGHNSLLKPPSAARPAIVSPASGSVSRGAQEGSSRSLISSQSSQTSPQAIATRPSPEQRPSPEPRKNQHGSESSPNSAVSEASTSASSSTSSGSPSSLGTSPLVESTAMPSSSTAGPSSSTARPSSAALSADAMTSAAPPPEPSEDAIQRKPQTLPSFSAPQHAASQGAPATDKSTRPKPPAPPFMPADDLSAPLPDSPFEEHSMQGIDHASDERAIEDESPMDTTSLESVTSDDFFPRPLYLSPPPPEPTQSPCQSMLPSDLAHTVKVLCSKQMEDFEVTFENKLEQHRKTMDDALTIKLDETRSTLQARFPSHFEEVRSETQHQLDKLRNEARCQIESLKSSLDSTISNKLAQTESNFKDEMRALLAALRQKNAELTAKVGRLGAELDVVRELSHQAREYGGAQASPCPSTEDIIHASLPTHLAAPNPQTELGSSHLLMQSLTSLAVAATAGELRANDSASCAGPILALVAALVPLLSSQQTRRSVSTENRTRSETHSNASGADASSSMTIPMNTRGESHQADAVSDERNAKAPNADLPADADGENKSIAQGSQTSLAGPNENQTNGQIDTTDFMPGHERLVELTSSPSPPRPETERQQAVSKTNAKHQRTEESHKEPLLAHRLSVVPVSPRTKRSPSVHSRGTGSSVEEAIAQMRSKNANDANLQGPLKRPRDGASSPSSTEPAAPPSAPKKVKKNEPALPPTLPPRPQVTKSTTPLPRSARSSGATSPARPVEMNGRNAVTAELKRPSLSQSDGVRPKGSTDGNGPPTGETTIKRSESRHRTRTDSQDEALWDAPITSPPVHAPVYDNSIRGRADCWRPVNGQSADPADRYRHSNGWRHGNGLVHSHEPHPRDQHGTHLRGGGYHAAMSSSSASTSPFRELGDSESPEPIQVNNNGEVTFQPDLHPKPGAMRSVSIRGAAATDERDKSTLAASAPAAVMPTAPAGNPLLGRLSAT